MCEHLSKPLVEIPTQDAFYVYLLRCNDDSLYCGWTTNLQKRFYLHKEGRGAKYTRAHPPLEIFYYEVCLDATTARKREYQIKQMKRKEKLMLPVLANIKKSL